MDMHNPGHMPDDMADFMYTLMANGALQPVGPPTLSCPLCKEEYAYKKGDTSVTRLADRCTHEARVVYCKHVCSICLEEYETGVALKCGHVLCGPDFCKIGGKMGQDAMTSAVKAAREEQARRQQDAEAQRQQIQAQGGLPPEMQAMLQGASAAAAAAAAAADNVNFMEMLQRMMGPALHELHAFDEEEDDDQEEEDSDITDDGMPPLLGPDGRGARNVNDDDSISDDDGQDWLPLGAAPSGGRNNNNNNNDDDSSTDSDMPTLLVSGGRAYVASSDEDSVTSNEVNMPELLPRSNNSRGNNKVNSQRRPQASHNGDGSDDEDDSSASVPPLLPRDDEHSSAGGSEEDPPALENNAFSDSSSDDDGNIPPLDARGSQPSDSDDSSVPLPVARRHPARQASPAARVPRQQDASSRRRGAAAADSDDSSQGSALPGLMARSGVNPSDNDDDDSDELPELVNRGGVEESRHGNLARGSRARSRHESEGRSPARSDVRSSRQAPAAAATPSRTAGRTSDGPQSYEEFFETARVKGSSMKPSQLKKELRKMGVNIDNFIEKSELIQAYATEKARRNMNNVIVGDENQRPAPIPVPFDPLADLPPLVPFVDHPENGAWIRTPKSTSLDELQYVVLDKGDLRSQTMQVLETEYSYSVIASHDGVAFLHAQIGDKHEIHQMHCSDISRKVFDIQVPNDTTIEMTPSGAGSFYMLYPETQAVESTWKLVYRSQRIPAPQTLLSNLPFSTRMHTCASGYVWLDVGQDESDAASSEPSSNSLTPGLWYVSRWEQKHVLTPDDLPDDEHRFVTVDATRNGLWILRPTGDADSASCVLIHVDRKGNKRDQNVQVGIKMVQAMVNGGSHRDGVFVHFKTLDRWKLGVLTIGKSAIDEYCDCARNSQIVSCGWGGVWVWKKGGRQRTLNLAYVDQEKKVHEYSKSFHRDAELVGLQE